MALFLKNSNDNQNAQGATTQRAQRSSSPQNYTTQITTTKGTQYTLDNNQVDWIKSRYKQDVADTYGWDDADQYARKTGQLSAKMQKTYKNSNVDRQLAEMGLPSEKNLEKYIADYQNWHTGGISDYFGKDAPQDFYTKTKEMFKGDWQYDDTQEDQLRKNSGQMPSKLASKYTDTEIDDELRAAGLPPVAEMGKYIGRYNNYSAIDNLYKNAAVEWANLGITKDKNGQYIQNDDKVYTMEDGRQRKGKDLYSEAFYNVMGRKNENGDYVYGNIFNLFKNNHLEEYDPDDYDGTNYNQYLGKEFVNASKVADLADDYAAYTAFSYDDFAGKYGDYYDQFLKNYKFSNGQTLEEIMNGIDIKNDEQAQREFYDVSDKWFDKGRGTSDFVARYKQMYPSNTYEQMFTDMLENGVPESTVRKTMTTLRKDTNITGGKNRAEDNVSGFNDITDAFFRAKQNYMSAQRTNEEAIAAEAEELTSEDAVRRIEDYMSESGGWTAENATKALDALVEAGVDAGVIRDAVADMRAQFADSEYRAAMDALGAYELKEAGDEAFDEFTVKKYQKELRAAQRDARKQYAEDEATIQTAYDSIDKMLTGLVTTDEGVASVNDVIAVLDSIESASWNNPVSMEKALERYGFVGNGQFTGLAEKLTKNWSNDDKLKLFYNIGSVRTADVDPENNDFIEKFTDIFGGDWLKLNEAPVTKRSMQYADFSSALDWAKEQIASGTLTEAQAYQVLSAEGYSPELEQYVGEDWHRAVYEDLHVPMMFQQAGGAQLAMWEEMTPDERKKMASDMYDSLSAEEKAAMFGDADWWKSDPTVYRTFGQAFEQQFAAILPGLATDLIASGAELGDMIGASFTGRPELNDSTKDWLKMQEFVQNYGSVYDDVNGTKVADVAASVVGEIARMQVLGMVGAGVGSAFEATGIGGKLAKLAAGDPGIVKKATGMALSLVRSSPFVANAWAHDYAELKSLGASNSEAMWNSMITGMAEGILEGFNFDNLWGKVLGQEAFATEILDAGKRAFGTAGIVWKARIANMAASGLGEFTEESIGYVLDTYLKMRHSDTWGKGTEWSASGWLSQAGMGFLVGAIGGGMASMDITANRILADYAMSSEEGLRAVFPDVVTSDGIWDNANETVRASYETGGATVLSSDAYKQLNEQAQQLVASAQKTLEQARADEAGAQEKINNAESEVRKLQDKIAPYLDKGKQQSMTGEEAKEFASLYAKWNEAVRHSAAVRNEVMEDLAEKAGNHERSLQNAESQLKDIQNKIREHFCGIHLMNEGATPEQAFENMMNAYQNGFKVEGKKAQAVVLDGAQAGQTTSAESAQAGTEETSTAQGENMRAVARENAFNRVYNDQEAGKAYGSKAANESGKVLTPAEFVEGEMRNFKAKTTAKVGNITLELAGFETADGMSSSEIIDAAKQVMTESAVQKLDAYMKLSKALDLPMVIRDVVAGASGYLYDGKIYVTLSGDQAVLRVASHELTHWMKDKQGYDSLRNHLISDVGGKEAFDKMVAEKAKEYGIDTSTEDGRVFADDEVCAELCEKMLENKESLQRFVSKDLDAAKSLRSRLSKTLKAVKSIVSSLGDADYKTRGDLIKEQETIETWYKNLSEAIDEAEQYEAPPLDMGSMPPEDYDGATFNPMLDNDMASRENSITPEELNGYVPKANPNTGVTVEDDAEYMRAALAGDTETAGRMVRDMYERNGLLHVYRGEPMATGSWTQVDMNKFKANGMFATPDLATAQANEYTGSYAREDLRTKPLSYGDEMPVLQQFADGIAQRIGRNMNLQAESYYMDDEGNTYAEDGTGREHHWALRDVNTGDIFADSTELTTLADAAKRKAARLVGGNPQNVYNSISDPFAGRILDLFVKFDNANEHDAHGDEWDNIQINAPKGVTLYRIEVTDDPDSPGRSYIHAYPIIEGVDADSSSEGERQTKSVEFTYEDEDMDYTYKMEQAFKKLFGPKSDVAEFFFDYANWTDGGATLDKVGVRDKNGRYVSPELFPDAETISTDELAARDKAAGYDGSIIRNVRDGGPGKATDTVSFNPNYIKSADAITYDDNGNIIPLSERGDFGRNELRYSVDSELASLIDQYGAQPQGREPRASDVRVPNRTQSNNRVSRFGRSVMESGHMTDEMRERGAQMMASEDWLGYIPKTNEESMEEARNYIAQRQPLQAQQEFHDMVMQGKLGRKTNAIGLQLLADASNRGDVDSFFSIATDLQIAATEAGQSAQIFNVLKELKGVGSAYYMQRVIDRLNTKYDDLIQKGKMERITVPQELMNNLSKATTVDEIANAEEAVAKAIANQLPLTWDDRMSNWRYFSMLANPTTHVRNMFGNLLMKGLNTAKDAVATGIEAVGGVSADQRGHAILTSADKAKWQAFADESYKEQARNLSGGGKLGFETFVEQNKRSFDTKWLNALAKLNFKLLEGEDIMFIRPAYKTALMEYMKAQGYTLNDKGIAGKFDKKGKFVEMSNAQKTAAVEWASQQAWKQTFRDASSLATLLNKLSKENKVSKLLVEGVMPFKKTPINIARRGLEYSPAGIIMGTTQLLTKVKQGKMTAAQAIDNLASGITGSALMALGVALAKMGLIRAGGEDKKKYETYLQDTGDQTYAMKFGDYSVNMSAIAPATIPLFMGVALNEMIEQSGDSVDLSTITDTIAGTLNPFMEMSFMASLNSALKNYNSNGIGGALGGTLMTAAQNYGSQYLPTLGGKIAQFADPTLRSTKSSATSPVGGNMDYYARSLAKKVPGLEATLQPDVNVWGQTTTKDTFSEWAWDFANKFILPTNVKVTNRDAVDRELIRVVESTGVTDFLPSDGNKYFTVKGQKYNMNARQYAEFSQERGQAAYAALKDVMASPAYINASDEKKADMLNKAKEAAYKAVNNIWKDKLGAFNN